MDKEDLYTLKSNRKGKRTAAKANKGINAEKNDRFKNLRLRKEETPQNCKSPM